MIAFISWEDWRKITREQKQLVEAYGENFQRNSTGIAFEIEQSRIDEILAELERRES